MKDRYSWLIKWVCGGALITAVLSVHPCSFEQPARARLATIAGREPLTGPQFQVEVDGKSIGLFSSCSGMGSAHEVIEQKSTDSKGGAIVMKVPGRLRWHDVTLRRGLTSDMSLWTWRQQVVDGQIQNARKRCTITAIGPEGKPQMIWELLRTWPSNLIIRAEGAGDAATEEVIITCEEMVRKL